MVDIRDAVDDLVRHPVRPPTAVGLIRRRTARRRRYRWSAALSAITVVVGVGIGLAVSAHDQPSEKVQVGPVSPAPSGAGATPAGFVRVNYRNASIAVPAGWEIYPDGESGCSSAPGFVLLGNAQLDCAPQSTPASIVRFTQLTPKHGTGSPIATNGHSGFYLSPVPPTSSATYIYPDLQVMISISGPDTSIIASTVGWSAEYLALHPASPVTVPAQWRSVSYEGVRFKVPSTWPLLPVHYTSPIPCDQFEFSTSALYEGAGTLAIHCPYMRAIVTSGVDAVWVRSYQANSAFPPPGAFVLSTNPRVALLNEDNPTVEPVITLVIVNPSGGWDALDIGIGSNPNVAAAILASITHQRR